MNKTSVLLFIITGLISQGAWAFFHFEPGIGYNRGHFQTNKVQGIGLTVKTGVEFNRFFMLADVGYHDLQLGSTPTSTATDIGLAIGGDFKSWRAWFTYVAATDLKIDSAGTTVTHSGDGMKVGFSGKMGGDAYVNLEIRFLDYNDIDGAPTTEFMDAALLSVSWVLY